MGRASILSPSSHTRSPRAPLFIFLALTALAAPSARAQSAGAWEKRGRQAELREDYDASFEAFRQAHLKKPGDLRYKTEFERLRFQAGAQHIDRGRVLRQNGDSSGALAQFLRAYQIDPSNQTAQQEIAITENPGNYVSSPADLPGAAPGTGPNTPGTPPTPPGNTQTPAPRDILANLETISGPVELQPVSSDPITLHAVEDVKVIYQSIGKLAGLNVLFDPDYTSKRIPVDLTSVSLSDSLRIVGTIAGTFYKPVTPNTIFVAQNTRTKRNDLDELAVQTFYLTNPSQAQDANEIMTGLRNLMDPSTKIYLVPSQNAIVMRATQDQLLLAQKLLNDLDRARPEVVVDVAVLEVNKDHIRNLGITLPTSIGIAPQVSSTTNSTTNGSSSTPASGTPTTTPSNFTLNTLANLNATNFAVSITGGTLNALLTDSDTRVLQNPRIRATDGQRATLKIGSKIPVATGSYNAGAATGVGSGIGVQTQFTYLDVGVNIDMTPTVHFDREVSLKMKIEVSSHTGDSTISGVTEPIISQRVIEQVIQLKEGEPSILAGILQKQDNRNSSGTPGLGELPFLKYFFGSQFRENQQDEVVFLLIPHIVRESVLTQLNTRAIDTGTNSSIELRHDASLASTAGLPDPAMNRGRSANGTTTAANAAAAMVQQMKQQAAPPVQPPPTPYAAPAGDKPWPINLNVLPADSQQAVGSTFQVAVNLANGKDVSSVPLELTYNPKVLQLVNVDAGTFLGSDGQAVAMVRHEESSGVVSISASRPPTASGMGGNGQVCTLTFKAIAAGDSSLALTKVAARSSTQASLPVIGSQAMVHVK